MGLLSFLGGTKTYVASTLYNLSGEPLERSDYLKTSVMGAMIVPGPDSLGKSISNAYLSGPGLRLRSFFNWAEDNYTGIGVPTGSLGGNSSVDSEVVQGEIPAGVDETISVSHTEMGIADYFNWAEQWLAENNPTALETEYIASIDEATSEITITYEDTTTDSFIPSGYDVNGVYLYSVYTISTETPPDPPVVTGPFIFIYKMGDGNAVLDALIIDEADDGEYIPYIPVRLENEFLSETFHPESYALAKKAYKKVSRGNLDDVIATLNDNEYLNEIDYAYIFFGVPLNVLHQSCRAYLYNFFNRLRLSQTNSNAEFLIWQAAVSGGGVATAPENVVEIKSNGSLNTNFNFRITWITINRETGTGLGKPGANEGEYWLEVTTVSGVDNVVEIWHQITDDSWEKLIVIGAVHNNLIYNNQSVIITAVEALADLDESGFLVPLHYDTLYDMGIKQSTEIAAQSSFVVLNSYQVVKKKWYQTGVFKIFVFVVIIVVTIVYPPLGGAALATYASIGAAIGLAGVLAVVAGAIIYTIATMILMKIIGKLSTEVFGEKFGQIVGAILAVVAAFFGTQFAASGTNLSAAWSQLMNAQNLLMMTNSIAGGIAGYKQVGAIQTMEETQELLVDYQKQYQELAQKFADEFGYGRAMLDPLSLTDSGFGNGTETSSQFLSRTLMTGTDIAELSKDMLNNFVNYTLTLDPSRGIGG